MACECLKRLDQTLVRIFDSSLQITHTYESAFRVCSSKCRLSIDFGLQVDRRSNFCELWNRSSSRRALRRLWSRPTGRFGVVSKYGV